MVFFDYKLANVQNVNQPFFFIIMMFQYLARPGRARALLSVMLALFVWNGASASDRTSCLGTPTVVAQKNDPSCADAVTGTITAAVTQLGAPPFPTYEYRLDGPVTRPYQSSGTFSGLPSGNYTVVSREVGCTFEGSTSIALTGPAVASITGASAITTSQATVSWSAAGGGNILFYTVRYRVAGSPNWTTLSGIPSSFVSRTITGLQNNTTYQVQIASTCSAGGLQSGFYPTAPFTFTTGIESPANGCLTPSAVFVLNENYTSGEVRWTQVPAATCYLVSYGITGSSTTTWPETAVGNVSSTTITGLTPGTSYRVRLRAVCGGGCTGTVRSNFSPQIPLNTIPCPSSLTLNSGATSVTACGSTTLSVTNAPTGSGLTYAWQRDVAGVYTTDASLGAGASALITTSGNYRLVLTVNGCTNVLTSNPIAVTVVGVLTVTSSATNVSCLGGSNGTVTATPVTGTAPYSYLWTTGAATATATGLIAGNYTATVTDANGCTGTVLATVTQPSVAFTSMTTVTRNVLCHGEATGEITTAPMNGINPYTFNWSNGSGGATLSNVVAGTYTVTIIDGNGCQTSTSGTITQPTAPLTLSTTATNVTCIGGMTGEVTSTVTGGTGAIAYSWSNGQMTANLSSLVAGTYTLTVTDANNCTRSSTATVTEPATGLVISTATITNVLCHGNTTGAADMTVTGAPVSFLWAPGGATTEDLSNVVAGTYTLTATDAAGCTRSLVITITQPAAPLAATVSGLDVTCNGGNNGTIDVAVTGGTTPYTYNWGAQAGMGGMNRTMLPAGTYTVTITDGNGCTLEATDVVTEPTAIAIATTTVNNARCLGAMNGSIDITVSGGITPYTYSWNMGAFTMEDLMNIGAGAYTVVVTDANMCTRSATITVTEPATNPLMVSMAVDHVDCFNGADGEATVTATMGLTPYMYTWSANAGSALTAGITGRTAGTYTVTVVDANGCVRTSEAVITQPGAYIVTLTPTHVACNGAMTGRVNTAITGGNGGDVYLWNNGASTTNLMNVAAGAYTVTVTDIEGCTAEATVTLTEPTVLAATATATNVACRGDMTGSVMLSTTGGVTAYTYLWSNGATTQNLMNVVANMYQVTVTDANMCQVVASATVAEPATLMVPAIAVTNVLCRNGMTGSLTASATGGGTTYGYRWDNGSTNATISALAAGSYTVTVTDNLGCSKTASATITQPANIVSVIATVTNATCNGLANGSAQAIGNGGVPGYTYLWSNGNPTDVMAGVAAGIYTVTATDANGCTSNLSVVITQPAAITLTATAMGARCNGGMDGTITVTATGGTVPTTYAYDWNGNGTYNEMFANIGGTFQEERAAMTGLMAGTYVVTVTDVASCTSTISVTVTQPGVGITALVAKQDVACFGASTGSLMMTPSGGQAPYTAAWSHLVTGLSVTNLPAGTYTATITDALGCQVSITETITQPVRATTIQNVAVTNVVCKGQPQGSIYLDPTGGNDGIGIDFDPASAFVLPTPSNFLYNWSNGTTANPAINLMAGTYMVTVTDARGCMTMTSVMVAEPAMGIMTTLVSKVNPTCLGAMNGSIDIDVMGGTPTYNYQWSNGAVTEDLVNVGAGIYNVTVTDVNFCATSLAVTLTQPATAIAATAVNTNVNCYGAANATGTASAMGGAMPYTYRWNNGQTTATATGLAGTFAGILYTVTVSDANMCTSTAEIVVTQPENPVTLSASSTIVNVACKGAMTGSINPNDVYVFPMNPPVFGGVAYTGPNEYLYRWSNGATTRMASMLAAGTYTLTITDNNGCTSSHAYMVTEPAAMLMVSGVTTNVTGCAGGFTGAIDLSVMGGVAPYTYNWSTGSMNQDVTMLGVGNYNVTVTDAGGCATFRNYTVTGPTSVLTAVHNQTNILCFGVNNGAIDVTVTGGMAPYAYMWSNTQTTQDLMNLTAGDYTLTVTDAAGCTTVIATTPPMSNGMVTITAVAGPALSFGATTMLNVTCHGAMTGEITWTPMGGTGAYNYIWNNGLTSNTSNTLAAGTYMVTVTDANGCSLTNSATITQPAMGIMIAENMITNISCFGASTGAIDLSLTGGTPGAGPTYTYLWSNAATTQDISGLPAGQYTVTVTDANGCQKTYSKVLTQPATGVMVSANVTQMSCASLFSVDVMVSGGMPAYTYNWNNITSGIEPEDQNMLTPAMYTITVTDAMGCTVVRSIDLTTYPVYPITLTSTKTDVACFGAMTGAIDLTVTGGRTPMLYNWNNGIQNEDQMMIAGGMFMVTVTDASGCTATHTVTVNQPTSAVTATWTKVDPSCGMMNGAIDVTVSGGTGALSVNWADIASTPIYPATEVIDRAGLSAGLYAATVTDANGCVTNFEVTLASPGAPTVVLTPNHATCPNDDNGSIVATASMGTAPYTYAWSNGQVGMTASSLVGTPAGMMYTITVTDAKGCTVSATTTVTSPNVIRTGITFCAVANLTACLTPNSKHVSCHGMMDGRISVTPTGGTANYFINLSNGQSQNVTGGMTADFGSLAAGSYVVTITDMMGCMMDTTLVITQPAAVLAASIASTNENCASRNNGTISLNVMGGTTAYTFLWNDAVTTQNRTNVMGSVAGTTYTVTVTDANGCNLTRTATITEPAPIAVTHTMTAPSCFNGTDGKVTHTAVTGGVAPYTYLWNDLAFTKDRTDLTEGDFTVTVTDAAGCTNSFVYTLTQPLPFYVYANAAGSTPAVTTVDAGFDYATVELLCETDTVYSFLYEIGYDANNDGLPNNDPAPDTRVTSFNVVIRKNGAIIKTRTFNGAGPHAGSVDSLSYGNYEVEVRNNFGCMHTYAIRVIEPTDDIVVTNYGLTPVTMCVGGNNGGANLIISDFIAFGGNANEYSLRLSNGFEFGRLYGGSANYISNLSLTDNIAFFAGGDAYYNNLTALTTGLSKGVYTLTVTAMDNNNSSLTPLFCSNSTTVLERVFTFVITESMNPFNLTAANFTPTSPTAANITVSNPGGTQNWGYEVEIRQIGNTRWERFTKETNGNGGPVAARTFNTSDANSASSTIFGDGVVDYFRGQTVLVSGVSYQGRVRTICNGQPSTWSNPVTFTTQTPASTGCGTITNLRATSTTTTSAMLRWNAPTGAQTVNAPRSYTVYIRESGNPSADFNEVACFNSTGTSLSRNVVGLGNGTTYDVMIRTRCLDGAYLGTCASTPDASAARQNDKVGYEVFTTAFPRTADQPAAVASEGAQTISVYPNPNKGAFNVRYTTTVSGKIALRMTDVSGRTIVTRSFDVTEGVNILPVEVEGYSAGVYVLQLEGETGVNTTKVILN